MTLVCRAFSKTVCLPRQGIVNLRPPRRTLVGGKRKQATGIDSRSFRSPGGASEKRSDAIPSVSCYYDPNAIYGSELPDVAGPSCSVGADDPAAGTALLRRLKLFNRLISSKCGTRTT